MTAADIEQTDFILRYRPGSGDRVYCDAQWRYRVSGQQDWTPRKKRLGVAWRESDGAGGWRKRRGRCPVDHLDEHTATLAAADAMKADVERVVREAQVAFDAEHHRPTVRKLAQEWLVWLESVKGVSPGTLQDYGYLLREPGTPHKRGKGVNA